MSDGQARNATLIVQLPKDGSRGKLPIKAAAGGLKRNCSARFSLRIRSARLDSIVGMLRMIGYEAIIAWAETCKESFTRVDIELDGISEPVAEILLGWLLTIPDVAVAALTRLGSDLLGLRADCAAINFMHCTATFIPDAQ